MKKRRPIKPHKDNIFLFPNVEKLLIEKGIDKLQNKKYTEAIDLLEKAHELDSTNEEVNLGLIIAYFETGRLLEAKNLTHSNLQQGLGDYFQLIDLYIMILLQLNEYKEIVSTIQVLLDEKEIPGEKLENFLKILEFSKRKLDSEAPISILTGFEEQKETDFTLSPNNSLNDQFLEIAKLSHMNIRPYLKGIKDYLQSEEGHPFLKTMLLQLLKEQEINEEIIIEKLQRRQSINPAHLDDLEGFLKKEGIFDILKKEFEQENPTLYESIKAILERHSFLLFPLKRIPTNSIVWAAAYHFLALEYYGIPISMEKLALKYHVNQSEISGSLTFIRELEEISSPII